MQKEAFFKIKTKKMKKVQKSFAKFDFLSTIRPFSQLGRNAKLYQSFILWIN